MSSILWIVIIAMLLCNQINSDNLERSVHAADTLHDAAKNGNLARIATLCLQNVNLDEKINGTTALILATENNYPQIVSMLLEYGANPNQREDKFNETALFKASFHGFLSIVNDLIQHKADVNLKIKNDEQVLMWACFKGFQDIAAALLSHGASINAQDSKYQMTPLMVATKRGHKDIIDLLCNTSADPFIEDKRGETAKMKAFAQGNENLVKVLEDCENRYRRQVQLREDEL